MSLQAYLASQNEPLTGLMKSSGFTARKSIVVWTLFSPGFLSLGVSFSFGGLVEDILINVEYFLKTEWKIDVIFIKKLKELHSLNMSSDSACLLTWIFVCVYVKWLPVVLPNVPSLSTLIFNLVNFVHPKTNFWRCTSLYSKRKSPDNGLGVFYLPLADALAICGLSCSLQAKKKVSGHFFSFF